MANGAPEDFEGALDEGDEPTATSQVRCVGCGEWSPPTRTSQTLISTAHGWRLTRKRLMSGDFAFEWRCKECWLRHKQRFGGL